jgi:hypothetical protein
MSEQPSIFDTGLNAQNVTRSNARRNAVMIPLKQGQHLASLVKEQIEKEALTGTAKSFSSDLHNA